MTDALQTIMPKMPTAPKAALPREACDAHTHVFGPFDRFPLMLPPAYPPPEAPEARHLQMQTTVGARHGVIVQPAPYYTDPRCLIDALKQSTGRLRGIAIANPDVTDGVLHELDTAGARGLRFVDMFDPSGNRFGRRGVGDVAARAGAADEGVGLLARGILGQYRSSPESPAGADQARHPDRARSHGGLRRGQGRGACRFSVAAALSRRG